MYRTVGTQGIGIILVGTPLYSNLCLFMELYFVCSFYLVGKTFASNSNRRTLTLNYCIRFYGMV